MGFCRMAYDVIDINIARMISKSIRFVQMFDMVVRDH